MCVVFAYCYFYLALIDFFISVLAMFYLNLFQLFQLSTCVCIYIYIYISGLF